MRSWLIILIIAALTYLYFSQSNNQQALDSPTDPDSVIKLNTGIDSKDVEDTETIKKRRENVGSREASRLNKDQSEVLAAVKKDWPDVKSSLVFRLMPINLRSAYLNFRRSKLIHWSSWNSDMQHLIQRDLNSMSQVK